MSVCVCVVANDALNEEPRVAARFGEHEKARLEGIKNEKRYRESLGALVALDKLFEGREAPPILKRDENGKPYFESGDSSLSLSHSEKLSAAAIAADGKVGIDVERADRKLFLKDAKYKKIAARFFTQKEREKIDAAGNGSCADAERAFYELWTSKEACAKLRGDGLVRSLGKELPTDELSFYHRKLEYRGERYYLTVCADGENEFFLKLDGGIYRSNRS